MHPNCTQEVHLSKVQFCPKSAPKLHLISLTIMQPSLALNSAVWAKLKMLCLGDLPPLAEPVPEAHGEKKRKRRQCVKRRPSGKVKRGCKDDDSDGKEDAPEKDDDDDGEEEDEEPETKTVTKKPAAKCDQDGEGWGTIAKLDSFFSSCRMVA